MAIRLNKDFLIEYFKCALVNNSVLEIGREHLKYSYLPDQSHKKIWKIILNHYNLNDRPPSIGIIGQQLEADNNALSILADIKTCGIPNKDDTLAQLEAYIKNVMFQDAYDDLYTTFTNGEKEQAYKLLEDYSKQVNDFSIRNLEFDKVFEGFMSRHSKRKQGNDEQISSHNNIKIPFGIDELDAITRGGISCTEICCILAQSGVGKSKALKYIGVHAAKLGYKVAHFQFEGSRQECLDLYDATWSGALIENIERGILSEEEESRIQKALADIKNGVQGEIFVEAFEQFGTASMKDVRDKLTELEKNNGQIHLVLIDYLEKVDPGDGKRYTIEQEKQRRESVSQRMKNMAIEFSTRIVTATQAHGIEKKLLDNPDFVMDRYNTSMGKNLLDPFSYFLTLNQTEDEKNNKIMRIFCDKIRKYSSKQTIHIHQDYDREKFCDRKKTRNVFYQPKN